MTIRLYLNAFCFAASFAWECLIVPSLPLALIVGAASWVAHWPL